MSEKPFKSTAGDGGDTVALTNVKNEHFPKIRDWIKEFFRKYYQKQCFDGKQSPAANHKDENMLAAKVFRLLAKLVSFGYYDDEEDLNPLIPAIISCLDGVQKEDKTENQHHGTCCQPCFGQRHSPQKKEDKREKLKQTNFNKSENWSLFYVKKCAMEVMDLILNYRFYKRLHCFIYDFKQLSDYCKDIRSEWKPPSSTEKGMTRLFEMSNYIETDATSRCCTCFPLCLTSEDANKKKLPCDCPRLVEDTRSRLQYVFEVADGILADEIHLSKLVPILLDLAKYEDKDLVQDSIQLLNKLYSSDINLFKRAVQAQILTENSQPVHDKISGLLCSLKKYLDPRLTLSSHSSENTASSDEQDLTVEKEHTVVTEHEMAFPLRLLTAYCWLDEAEGFEPHQQNQKIIYNFGILSDVLTFMQAQLHSLSSTNKVVKERFLECLNFLRALACKNLQVQRRLFEYVNLFLKVAVHDGPLAEPLVGPLVGILLREIFSGGPSITLKIKEEQIIHMMQLVFKKEDCDTPSSAGLLMEARCAISLALQELVKVQELDLALRFNQALVIKHFNQMREDDRYYCKELLEEGKKEERLAWLKSDDPNDSVKVQQLLMMTDLLASCAVGKNSGTESVCCTVYSLEELVDILSDDDVPLYRKRPFTRFLVWVYMSFGSDRETKDAKGISHNEKLWKHLENSAVLIDNAAQYMQDMSTYDHSQYLTTKALLNSPQWKFIHQSEHGLASVPKVTIREAGQHKPSLFVYLPDVLLYLAEALLQLITVFYTNFYHSDSIRRRHESTSRKMFAALLKLCKPLTEHHRVYFGMEIQVKLYRRAVHIFKKVITRPCGGHHFYDFNAITRGRIDDEVVTTARQEYNKCYGDEMKLNEVFNSFVTHYQCAYQGPNTLRGQIDVRVKNSRKQSYSDFIDEEMKRPGREYLPLGKTFQEHVKCFTKQSASVNPLHSVSRDKIVRPVTERLIKQLEISLSQLDQVTSEAKRLRQVEVDIKSLQILRAIIYNQIVQIDPELKERKPEKYREQCKEKLHPVQRSIQNFDNAVSRLMPLLSHPCEEIVYEVLALIKVLLESGNKTVQTGLKSLISAREHRLFPTLQRILKQSAVAYRESQYLIARMKERIIADRQLGLFSGLKSFLIAKEEVKSLEAWNRNRSINADRDEVEMVQFRPRITHREANEDIGEPSTPLKTKVMNHVQEQRSWSTKLCQCACGCWQFHNGSIDSEEGSKQTSGLRKRVPFLAVYECSQVSEEIGDRAASILQFQDLKHIELAMKVLGLMCDGQYRDMQDYLREQKKSISSINMVGEVATFLQQIFQSRDVNPETIEVLHQLLQTLIEMCVGNYTNQEVIFNNHIMSIINHILQLDITDISHKASIEMLNTSDTQDMDCAETVSSDSSKLRDAMQTLRLETKKLYQPTLKPLSDEAALKLRKQALDLKSSAVELLEAMLEETSPKTRSLATQMEGGLDISAVQSSLVDFDCLSQDPELKKEEYEDNAERALFSSYHILLRLKDYGVSIEQDGDEEVKNVWEKCEKESKSVEIVYKNTEGEEILTKVNFQFSPERRFKEVVTSRVKWNVNRSSLDDKLRDFLEWMDALKKDTFHIESLKEYRLLKLFLKGGRQRYLLLLYLTLLLNLFAVIGLSIPKSTLNNNATMSFEEVAGPVTPQADYSWFFIVLYVFGSLHLFFSIWMVLEYFLLNWRNFVLPSFVYNNLLVSEIRRLVKPRTRNVVEKNDVENDESIRYKLYRALEKPKPTYSDVNIIGLRTVYVIVFLLSSICSLRWYGLFYCLCLLYIVVNNDILQRALQSVTKNGKSLLWVAALMLAILFIYSVISFVFLHESVNHEQLFCASLGQCFVTVIRVGLVESLGNTIRLLPQEFRTAGIRVLFDLSFFIIITTISLNIVFGIIVDSFSELRNEKFSAERDMKSVCFICGIPSHEFERAVTLDRGFKNHVTTEHNMWTYVYFSIYLDQIDTSDHNAIEKYVYDKMKDARTDYFPIRRALCLKAGEKKQLDEVKSLVKSMDNRIGSLDEMMKSFQKELSAPSPPKATEST